MPVDPDGAIAQLGERLLCKQEVVGSIPSGSTKFGWVRLSGLLSLFSWRHALAEELAILPIR